MRAVSVVGHLKSRGGRVVLRAMIATLALAAACSAASSNAGFAEQTQAAAVPASSRAQAAYKILSEDGEGERRSVAVRLPARVTEAEIRRLTDGIVARQRGDAGRLVVRFYLDGMALDQAPWAVATHHIETKVTISGLRVEEEELFLAELAQERRNLVGAWLTSPPAVPGRLAIYRDKGKLFAEWRLRSGFKTVDELAETRLPRGRRYDIKGESTGYFVVTAAGALELREAGRLVAVGERILLDKLPSHAVAAQTGTGAPAAGDTAKAAGGTREGAAAAEAAEVDAEAPVTETAPKSQPRKRLVRQQAVSGVKSAARDDGPVMRLQGQ